VVRDASGSFEADAVVVSVQSSASEFAPSDRVQIQVPTCDSDEDLHFGGLDEAESINGEVRARGHRYFVTFARVGARSGDRSGTPRYCVSAASTSAFN